MKKIFSLIAAVLFAGSMMADLLNVDFTQGQGDWTIDVQLNPDELTAIWTQSSQYGMVATAYTKDDQKNHESEAWLISPAIDLSAVTNATLAVSQARNFGQAEDISIKASKDGENWTDLELSEWPTGGWSFVDGTADLSAFVGEAAVQIAFAYTSSSEGAATWEIKTVSIVEGEIVGPDVTFLPADFAGQGTSSTGSAVETTKDGVTVSSNKGYGHDAALRVYKGGSFSIVSETEQIGKIVFTFGAYQGSAKDGGLESEIVVNAKEFKVESMESAAWFEKIAIFFGEFEPIEPVGLDTITVAEAVAIAEPLEEPESGKSTYTDKEVVVKGFAVSVYDKNSDGSWSFYMADQADAKGEFMASNATADADVIKGDFMFVKGKICKYKSSKGNIILQIYKGTAAHGEAPQGIENIVLTEKVQKVMVDGAVYVVRDGKMFNVLGAQVR